MKKTPTGNAPNGHSESAVVKRKVSQRVKDLGELKAEIAADEAADAMPEDPMIVGGGFPSSDYERAQLLVVKFGDELRFTGDAWFTWDEERRRWVEGGEMAYAWKMLPVFENLALAITNPDVSSKAFKAAKSFGNNTALENMLKQASRFKQVGIRRDSFDADPWSLGVENGIVDLQTGKLRDGRRNDHVTKSMGCAFDADAECPFWQQFLIRVFSGDDELIDLVWRAVGYSLTGPNY